MVSLVQKARREIRVLLDPREIVECLETLAKMDVPALCGVLQVSLVPRARRETLEISAQSACKVPVEPRVRMAPTVRLALLVPADPREIKGLLDLVELLAMPAPTEARETRETLVPLVRKVFPETVVPRENKEKLDPPEALVLADLSGSRERLAPSELLAAWVSRDPRETKETLVFLDLLDLSDPKDLLETRVLKETRVPLAPLVLVENVE